MEGGGPCPTTMLRGYYPAIVIGYGILARNAPAMHEGGENGETNRIAPTAVLPPAKAGISERYRKVPSSNTAARRMNSRL